MTLSALRPGDLRPELLAPAGDMDCARAANGADAIYFGLDRFNARLRANNFTLDSLPELMRFLHAHGVKGYVTMNTLIFTSELADALSYLGHLNAAGADGVIVQDIGLARCLTEWGRQVPGMKLELHASTQMTLSSPDGLEFASGFLDLKQAVLARELSLKEIGQCVRHTGIPLEVFVHGALCVAYRPVPYIGKPGPAQRQQGGMRAGLPPALFPGCRRHSRSPGRTALPAQPPGPVRH